MVRRDRAFALALSAALGLHLLLFAWSIEATAVLRPFSDMFDLVLRWFQAEEDGRFLDYLLDPHNYHRLVYLRLLIAADMRWLHGGEHVFLVVGILSLVAAPLILARPILKGAPEGLKGVAVALPVMLVLSTANAMDASIPIYTPYAQCLALSLACLVLCEGRFAPLGWAFAALAAFANTAALALWPVLLIGGFKAGERPRRLLLILALAGMFIGLYAFRQTAIGHEAHGVQVAKAAHYFLAFLGLPWTRVSGALGVVAGIAIAAASALALLFRGGAAADALERLAVRLVLFSLGAAGMAALGRLNVDEAVDVPLRYALFMAPLQIGLVLLALPWTKRALDARPGLVRPGLLALLAGLLVQQAAVAVVMVDIGRRMRSVIAAFEAGQPRTPEMRIYVHPDLDHAEAVRRRMIQAGLRP